MRALLFDSWFDTYVGVVCMLAVVDGVIKKGELRDFAFGSS
jgi:GTP-binding protein LepA